MIVSIMYVEKVPCKRKSKTYTQILLRESFRVNEGGKSKVKHRTIANLTRQPPELVAALRLALKQPQRVLALASDAPAAINLAEGKAVGAVWVVAEIARRLGISSALGRGRQSTLALWQIVARLLDQGSRLSAVRLHETHALADVLGLERGFNEDDLYANLAWLADNQARIETRLFKRRAGESGAPDLFLYDVTSSYFEGEHNHFAAYGYNGRTPFGLGELRSPRDGKRGKRQMVVGLLCDAAGEPVSVQVFPGNTQDVKTFADQVRKVAVRFGCRRVTFTGDRGMIKSGQVDELSAAGFHHITALTKPQIETLLREGAIQLELFDEKLCEIEHGGRRYILRRNPVRADELAAARSDKQASIAKLVAGRNDYLRDHPRAKVETARRRAREKIERLRCDKWLRAEAEGRALRLVVDDAALAAAVRLDGCYIITTDLPPAAISAEQVHARYKDLARVERAFRVCKTGHLELRPIHVRTEKSTRGHVFVVMLAYLIRRELGRAWRQLDATVEEGLDSLKTLTTIRTHLDGSWSTLRIPRPRENTERLLRALELTPPELLVTREIRVATKKKLPPQRLQC